MEKLVTITDIKEFKSLSANLNVDKKLNMFIIEAQAFDIMPFLGDDLYILLEEDFLNSPSLSTPKYADLFNGSTYTINGVKHRHQGIRSVLCYYSYARYLPSSKTNSTAFGMQEKSSDHSTAISEKALARQVADAKSLAEGELSKVTKFMRNHSTDYPTWCYGNKTSSRPRSGVKITAIGKGSYTKVGSSNRCRDCGRYSCYC